MPQKYKSIYFADHPSASNRAKHVRLAFSDQNGACGFAKTLTSHELRSVIGHQTYASLSQAAADANQSLNAYCVQQVTRTYEIHGEAFQPPLPFEHLEPVIGIDPIQATYRGGESEPLHRWYPYLEGYSPSFVHTLVRELAAKSENILDPFAGTGTTPLAVASGGRQSLYCELNPFLQFLIEAKIEAHLLAPGARNATKNRLIELAHNLSENLQKSDPDRRLQQTYSSIFGKSKFFTEDMFARVLQLRSLLDVVSTENPVVGRLATVAALSSLVPVSNLIRRGDLRFKTKEELSRGSPSLVQAMQVRLLEIAQDLEKIDPFTRRPQLLCSDARNLSTLPTLNADAVITSPPYLNGTNYFRNTKMELWFARCMHHPDDLTRFRSQAITCGINDVTVKKATGVGNESVNGLVQRLAESAYDSRIPRMVQTYFYDMDRVFQALEKHVRSKSPVLIDIGDSAYGGIHVDTPTLIAELAAQYGFELEKEIVLRRRTSRGGLTLRQVLLQLRANKTHAHRQRSSSMSWMGQWRSFKSKLPHQGTNFAKRNWGHPLHSLCSYQGKMKPSLAHHLVKVFSPQGGTILDPFGGVGTIAFEAALNGTRAWSFDISPPAVQIAEAKLKPAARGACLSVIEKVSDAIKKFRPTKEILSAADKVHFNGALSDYYHPKTFAEILAARQYFADNIPQAPSERLVFSCLLHVLHGNRPYALSRRSHPITPFSPTGPSEYRSLVKAVTSKVQRTLEVDLPNTFTPGTSLYQDATGMWPQDISDLDAVITSPPFFDSTRFYLANWIRLWFAGWDAEEFGRQPRAFMDERQRMGFSVYEPVFSQARERLRTGGVMILHLGRSKKCDMAAQLMRIARRWFRVSDIFVESVEHCESHGISDKGTVREHQYLVLT